MTRARTNTQRQMENIKSTVGHVQRNKVNQILKFAKTAIRLCKVEVIMHVCCHQMNLPFFFGIFKKEKTSISEEICLDHAIIPDAHSPMVSSFLAHHSNFQARQLPKHLYDRHYE